MSDLSKNSANQSNVSKNMQSANDSTPLSKSSGTSAKRSLAETVDWQTKKIKIEGAASGSVTTNAQASFVSAATLVPPMSEISDQELLEFTLEFERKHGI